MWRPFIISRLLHGARVFVFFGRISKLLHICPLLQYVEGTHWKTPIKKLNSDNVSWTENKQAFISLGKYGAMPEGERANLEMKKAFSWTGGYLSNKNNNWIFLFYSV